MNRDGRSQGSRSKKSMKQQMGVEEEGEDEDWRENGDDQGVGDPSEQQLSSQ